MKTSLLISQFLILLIFTALSYSANLLAANSPQSATINSSSKPSLSESDKINIILSFSKKLPSDTVFYNWMDRSKALKKINEKVWSDQDYLNKIETAKKDPNRGISSRSVAGMGIYLAEDPATSSIYGCERFSKDPALVEIIIDKGMPYIDLTNENNVAELAKKGVSVDDVYKLNPPMLIKYNWQSSWWVIKSNKGVHIRPYRGYNLRPELTEEFVHKIKYITPRKVYKEHISEAKRMLTHESIEDSIERNRWNICRKKHPKFYYVPLSSNSNLPELLGNTKNYSKLESIINENMQAFVIEKPKYNFQTTDFPISSKSNLDGVCKHFGYSKHIRLEISKSIGLIDFLRLGLSSNLRIVIDANGYPSTQEKNSNFIKNITCQ
ncbi:MAG: hypothetical protein HQK49_18870 [Oligoflexia bacterium]|nr:hypothetical protein [Oligoflexia bacterium]